MVSLLKFVSTGLSAVILAEHVPLIWEIIDAKTFLTSQ